MNIYAVIQLTKEKDPEKILSVIRDLDSAAFVQYASEGVYFIRFNGTAKQVSEHVGFSSGPKTGVVLGISQYHGFASRDLWNWMGTS